MMTNATAADANASEVECSRMAAAPVSRPAAATSSNWSFIVCVLVCVPADIRVDRWRWLSCMGSNGIHVRSVRVLRGLAGSWQVVTEADVVVLAVVEA